MSRQTLREYYDTNIKNKSDDNLYFNAIKHKMKKGDTCWRIKVNEEYLCTYAAHDYSKAGDVYVMHKGLIKLIDFARYQGLTVDHEVDNDEHFIIIAW